jgi:hypothetical protein
VTQAHKVTQALRDHRALVASKDPRVLLDQPENRVYRVLTVHQEQTDLKDRKVSQDHKERQVHKVLRETPETLDQQERTQPYLDLKDHREISAHRVNRA